VARDCGTLLLLALAVSAAVCAACTGRKIDSVGGSRNGSVGGGFSVGGVAGAGGAPQRVPPLSVPSASADAGVARPIDGATCFDESTRNAQDLTSRECLSCLCSVAPAPTAACDRDCWTLLDCVTRSGCDSENTQCILERCTELLGGVPQLAMSGMLAQGVPFMPCMMPCIANVSEDQDGGTVVPPRFNCEPPRAEPDTALVGESIALRWASGEEPDEYALSVEPWGSVGSFQGTAESGDAGTRVFRCDAPGTALISIVSDQCIAPVEVVVTCLAPEGTSCCPIEPIGADALDRCVQLGGSPPCFRGCDCLRNGGTYSAEPDAQGCLQWQLRPSRDSAEHLVCLDEAGNPSPDPRN